MADDNKPKIDLKARLGKKTVTGVGASIPPPMMNPGASIPAPPFASRPAASPEPEPVRVVEPQAIKIEMGEEVVEAQKKARSKWLLVALGTALLGGAIGYVFGGSAERGRGYENAQKGADILAGDVDKANAEIEKLSAALKKASSTLNDGKYPEADINAFGAINIPFDGTYLAGKGIGLYGADLNRLLLKFASESAAVNEQKDKLKRAFGSVQTQLTEFLAEQTTPRAHWSVLVSSSPAGPVASMQRLPAPFAVKDAWPASLEFGEKKTKIERYTKGEPMGSSPLFIPVDPGTEKAVCGSDVVTVVARELNTLTVLLAGDKSDPTNEKIGLIDTGSALLEKLKTVANGG